MEENTEVEFEGKHYLWDGQSWIDPKTYMVPAQAVVDRLDTTYRAQEIRDSLTKRPSATPRARSPRRNAGWGAQPAKTVAPPPKPVERITAFEGENAFLSNDAPAVIQINEQTYASVTQAYDAAYQQHTRLRPGMQREWDEEKRVPLIRRLLRSKFAQPELRARLLATEDKHLSHQSDGGDPFWHSPGGQGENRLGRLLMDLRAQFHRHYHLLTDDQIVEHLREYRPENPVIADDVLTRQCCWKRIEELAELYKNDLGAPVMDMLRARKAQLSPAS